MTYDVRVKTVVAIVLNKLSCQSIFEQISTISIEFHDVIFFMKLWRQLKSCSKVEFMDSIAIVLCQTDAVDWYNMKSANDSTFLQHSCPFI